MQSALEKYKQLVDGFEAMGFAERREAVANLGEDTHYHNKTTLKEVFRVKPKQGEISEYSYKGQYGEIACYTLKQCIAMRERSQGPRTPEQQEATAKLARQSKSNSRRNRVALMAREMVEADCLVLDSETSDLDGVVIEVALVSARTAQVVYSSLVHTGQPISDGAAEKHGITPDMLADAPSFATVSREIAALIGDRRWAAYNTEFDGAALRRSRHDANADCYQWLKQQSACCLMYDVAAAYFGPSNRHGSLSLSDAAWRAGVAFEGDAHRAAADALVTAKVLQYVASQAVT